VDEQVLTETLARRTAEVVRQQADLGLDVVSDGEFGKSSWYTYIYSRLRGYERRPAEPPRITARGQDGLRFAEYYADSNPPGFVNGVYHREVCVGPIEYIGHADMRRDVANFKAALAGTDIQEAFLPVIAPASISSDHQNEYYRSEEEYVFALADALHEEYQIIVDAGLILQLDDSIMVNGRDYVLSTGRDYRDFVRLYVEATNHALRGISPEQVRYHLCWGSWPGPHVADGTLGEIIDLILQINAQGLSIEAANPRHEWEWEVWQRTKLADGKILLPGVISHAATHVEHPRLVAQRIARFADLVGRENVIASTDCGFAQGVRTSRQHPSIQWAKLEALVEGARLASRDSGHGQLRR
jgi:5-methyltetrahydropteroyltriglutamate--homocysteine methyltransferase